MKKDEDLELSHFLFFLSLPSPTSAHVNCLLYNETCLRIYILPIGLSNEFPWV